MTSQCFWIYLLVLFDMRTADHVASFTIREVIMTSPNDDETARTKRHAEKQTALGPRNFVTHGTLGSKNLAVNRALTPSLPMEDVTTDRKHTTTDKLFLVKAEKTKSVSIPVKECAPCSVWRSDSDDDDKDKLNLTILPFAAIFIFFVCVIIKCTHWCNEDIRLADEKLMKISVPRDVSVVSRSPGSSRRSSGQSRGRRKQSTLSMKVKRQLEKSTSEDQSSVTNVGTSSDDVTSIMLGSHKRPLPAAAAAKSKGARRKTPQSVTGSRCCRQESLTSSVSTLNSMTSSRTASVKGCLGGGRPEECFSMSTLVTAGNGNGNGNGNGEAVASISHSASSETSFACAKLRLLSPPTLRLQLSSGETSTTSLGESLPSVASGPSVCDSMCTEQITLSQEQDCKHDADLDVTSGLCLSGSYYEDPLIPECHYVTTEDDLGDLHPHIMKLASSQMCRPRSSDNTDEDDPSSCSSFNSCSSGNSPTEHMLATVVAVTPNSICHSENTYEPWCTPQSPGSETDYRELAVSLNLYQPPDSEYYKLSTHSTSSTASLHTAESPLSCDSSGVLFPEESQRSRESRDRLVASRQRLSVNGVVPISRHVQNRRVTCRSWCLGDKASAIYDKLKRGLMENDYNL